jgi:hypothetical protein
VWQGHDGNDREIFLYNVVTKEAPVPITNNKFDDISPQTDGNHVIWLGFSQPNGPDGEVFLPGGEIFLYEISNGVTTQITNDSNPDSPPQIAGGRVVWASHAIGNSVGPGQIFLYDIATGVTEPLPNNTLDDSSPRINDTKVIWVRADGNGKTAIYMYDLTAQNPQPEPVPEGFVWTASPQIDGDLTVLTRYDGSDREIFIYSDHVGVYEQVTDNELEDNFPVISGRITAWVGGEGNASEIFLASYGSTIEKLRPRSCKPGETLRIIGAGFGDTQGDSVLHIGPKTYDFSSGRIKLWSDTKIRMRIPFKKKPCDWYTDGDGTYKKRKVWVTVGNADSNKKRLRVLKTEACP